MAKKYVVTLTTEERNSLVSLISLGKARARQLTHARILLKADQGPAGPGWTDEQIRQAFDVSLSTIEWVRERFVLEGITAALNRQPSTNPRRCIVDGEQEAHLVALTCSQLPTGHNRWTMRLLAEKMVELEYMEAISHETVRQVLKKRT